MVEAGTGTSSGNTGGGPLPAAVVSVTATGPTARIPNNSSTTLDVTVRNTGTASTAGLVFIDFNEFDDVRFTGVECVADGGAVCPVGAQLFSVSATGSMRSTASAIPPGGGLHYRVTEFIESSVSGLQHTKITATDAMSSASVVAEVAYASYIVQLSVVGGPATVSVSPGGMATYVMALTNAGPDPALSFMVTNDVGPQQTLVSTTCVAAGGAVCPSGALSGASMTVPSMPAGSSLQFTVNAVVAAGATGLVGDIFSAVDPGDRFNTDNVIVATTTTRAAPNGSFLIVRSDPGDPAGVGATYAYSPADALFEVDSGGSDPNLLIMSVAGDIHWSGTLRFSGASRPIQPGTYLLASGSLNAPDGSFSWNGSNGGCPSSQTQFTVDSVSYSGGNLSAIDLHFDQVCTGASAALHVQLHWRASDTTQPPGPINPPPPVWRAPAGATPTSGNYIYLESDAGDPLGKGAKTTLTQANAIFSISSSTSYRLNLDVKADDDIHAVFTGLTTQAQLSPGYYGRLQTWPASNPAIGSMDWGQGGRGCNSNNGWFVIDAVRYSGTTIAAVDARFELHCDNLPAALRGQIHWAPGDLSVPPGPIDPPPDLWTAPAGATPASGNYVYLNSDVGDFPGGGLIYLMTAANSTFSVTASGANVQIVASAGFGGQFVGMNTVGLLQPGYYAGLKRFPFNNPTKGGMDVGVNGFGCNTLMGWFIVDRVSYSGTALTSIDLRFEQHCEGATPRYTASCIGQVDEGVLAGPAGIGAKPVSAGQIGGTRRQADTSSLPNHRLAEDTFG